MPRAIAWWLLVRMDRDAPRIRAFDLDIVVDAPSDEVQDLQRLTTAALQLMADIDIRRLARLRRDIDQILVSPLRTVSGAYIPGSRSIYLSARFVATHSSANVAIIITHEGTHARLDRAGMPLAGRVRRRIEQSCVRQEIAFADRLPRDLYPEVDDWIVKAKRQANLR